MEQPEKAAAKAETEGGGRVLLEGQRGVVELELVERLDELRVLLGGHGVDGREDDRLGFFVARQGLGSAG
jgi:hypothetical protein